MAILALEAIDERKAILDLGEPFGAGVDALGIVAQCGAGVANGCASRRQLLREIGKTYVEASQFFYVANCGAQRPFRRSRAFIELIVGAHRGGVELFRVSQNALFGFEPIVFAS